MTSDEIISVLVNKLSFKQDENEHNSFYRECPIGGDALIVVRISNHRTYLQTWADRYKPIILPNKKVLRRMGSNLPTVNRKKWFYSFVFEDEQDTVGKTSVENGRKINVTEIVNKASQFTMEKLNAYLNALQKLCTTNQFDGTILGNYEVVSSTTPSDNTANENKQHKTRYNMKKTIRLTENDLHRIVKQAINELSGEMRYEEAIPQIENGLRSAKYAYQSVLSGLPQEALDSAKRDDGLNLYDNWHYIEGAIDNALENLRIVKYFMNIPTD